MQDGLQSKKVKQKKMVPCTKCKGTGKYNDATCPSCNGKGVKELLLD